MIDDKQAKQIETYLEMLKGEEGSKDFVELQLGANIRLLEVIKLLDPYVVSKKSASNNEIALELPEKFMPGQLSKREIGLIEMQISKVNDMAAQGIYTIKENRDISLAQGWQNNVSWAEQFELKEGIVIRPAVKIKHHWYGTCVCLDMQETRSLINMLAGGATVSVIAAYLTIEFLIPSAMAMVIALALVGTAVWVGVAAARSPNGGVCIFNAYITTVIVPDDGTWC